MLIQTNSKYNRTKTNSKYPLCKLIHFRKQ